MSADYQLVHELVSTQFVRSLHALKNLLSKASAHAKANNFDENKFLDLKLAPDMFNLTKQIQIATDNAKGAAARLTGTQMPSYPDTEKTMPELMARIDTTINFLTSFKAQDYAKFEEIKASFPWNPNAHIEGRDYVTSFALPNFYFHVAMTYSLLRNAGVNIGKGDFLGEINWRS